MTGSGEIAYKVFSLPMGEVGGGIKILILRQVAKVLRQDTPMSI